ncbi:hypothetical protein [Streptomyces sp. NPDC059460]|uniref:hypothetical protein n=1 Tax=Streptomyces sp. NPDC059460 TaxID=3346840 RepID=UPI0036C565C3
MSNPTRKGFSGQIKRGPMAADIIGRDFTMVYNAAVRDRRLSRRARGLLVEILSHRDGFGISEASLIANGPEKRDAIRTTLRELERYGYLHRTQSREGGKFGETVFEVTDMPEGLLIGARAPWEAPEEPPEQNPRSEPMTENPSTVDETQNRRSEPMADLPSTDLPSTVNPRHKKINPKKTNNQKTNSVRPSVVNAGVHETSGSGTDGGTDGGGSAIGYQEQRPVAAGGVDAAVAGAAPDSGSNRAGGVSLGPVPVVRVEMTPGVQVLRAVAAEVPEWTITHAESLRDQGLVASGMLLEGFTPQEIRHALLSKPLPQPVRTTVAAVVGRRLRDLIAAGPAAGVRPIPVQQRSDGYDLALGRPDSRGGDETWAPPSWAEQRAQLETAVSGRDKHRPCAGDQDLCPNLALPGSDLCAVCQGGEQPRCADGCGRGVVAPGVLCLACAEQPATTEPGDCPGYGGKQCGRAVQTAGLCGRCKIATEEAKLTAEAEWEAARTAAVTAAEAAETADAAHTVTA